MNNKKVNEIASALEKEYFTNDDWNFKTLAVLAIAEIDRIRRCAYCKYFTSEEGRVKGSCYLYEEFRWNTDSCNDWREE